MKLIARQRAADEKAKWEEDVVSLKNQLALQTQLMSEKSGMLEHMKARTAQSADEKAKLQEDVASLKSQLASQTQQLSDKSAVLENIKALIDFSFALWVWKDDHGRLHAFDMAASPQIERAFQAGAGTCRV